MNPENYALEGLASGEDLERVYKRRNKKYLSRVVAKESLQQAIDEGWEKASSRTKDGFRIRKPKDTGSGFEDEVWCVFKRMGFAEMNAEGTFVISRSGTSVSKQIDIFAKDEQCVCIVECKAADTLHTKRSLDKDIDQISAIRHDLELTVFSHYRVENEYKKLKVAWILATRNIDISENDRERAEQARVRIIDDIDYYSELSKHLGTAARYQFLADMFPGGEIPNLMEPVNAMRGCMGGLTFYSFVIEPEELLKISYISHRAKTGEESMKTYQRMAKKSRLKRMADYIRLENGIFPTSIVINIETDKPLKFENAEGMAGRNAVLGRLYIPNKYRTAWIIDGQHRLFAYSGLEEAKTATLPVIAFENLDSDKQAQLFVDINGEQVRVPKSLLSDLWATIHWNSKNPDEQLKALTSRLVKELDEDPRSPLRDRIVHIGGRRTQTRNITLAALVDEIRRHQLLGFQSSRKSKVITPGSLFVDDLDTTLARARDVISGYLSSYLEKDPNVKRQWELGSGEGGYIGTNSGIIAVIRVLKAILDQLENKDGVDIKKIKPQKLVELIWKYQEPVCKFLGNASSRQIQDFRSQYGEAGFRACTLALLSEINHTFSNFDPPGLREWIQTKNTVNNPKAYDIICEIETGVMRYVTNALKMQFGPDVAQWWHNGIPDRVAGPAVQRAQNSGEYVHFEKFLDFIDWREVIEDNHQTLGSIFLIDAKPNDSRKKQFKWISDVNEIRKIAMHPPRGAVTDEQLQYLKRVRDELMPRLATNQNQSPS